MNRVPPDITGLLQGWVKGDPLALERLATLVYGDLKAAAHRCMRRETPGNTLQSTALVNEAFLRLIGGAPVAWQDRAHFFALAAQTMRRILTDAARARLSRKRGGGAIQVNLDDSIDAIPDRGRELIALDDALNALAEFDPRKAKVVEMRFYGGLSAQQTAAVLKISEQSVLRDWKLAKAWLNHELTVTA